MCIRDRYKLQANDQVIARMWGAALTLVLIIGLLTVAARIISRRFSVRT